MNKLEFLYLALFGWNIWTLKNLVIFYKQQFLEMKFSYLWYQLLHSTSFSHQQHWKCIYAYCDLKTINLNYVVLTVASRKNNVTTIVGALVHHAKVFFCCYLSGQADGDLEELKKQVIQYAILILNIIKFQGCSIATDSMKLFHLLSSRSSEEVGSSSNTINSHLDVSFCV